MCFPKQVEWIFGCCCRLIVSHKGEEFVWTSCVHMADLHDSLLTMTIIYLRPLWIQNLQIFHAYQNQIMDLLSTREQQRLLLKFFSIEGKTDCSTWSVEGSTRHVTARKRDNSCLCHQIIWALFWDTKAKLWLHLHAGNGLPGGWRSEPESGGEKTFPRGHGCWSGASTRRVTFSRPIDFYLVKLSTKAECQRVQSLSRLLAAGVCP